MSTDYDKLAQELLDNLWVSYIGIVSEDTKNKQMTAQALERADVSGRIDEVEKAYLYQDSLKRLTTLRKRLEELIK